MLSTVLGANKFDQCVLNMALVNLCNQESYVGQEMRRRYNTWRDEIDIDVHQLWLAPHRFIIHVPHPDQEYEGISLEAGLSQGYNIDGAPIEDLESIPYALPQGGHFVVVLKQKGVNADFRVGATGIFVRPLGVLSLDVVIDPDKPEYQPIVIKHPIIRDYPSGWEKRLAQFINKEISVQDLPNLVGYVDQTINADYRPPSWQEIYLAATGFAGF